MVDLSVATTCKAHFKDWDWTDPVALRAFTANTNTRDPWRPVICDETLKSMVRLDVEDYQTRGRSLAIANRFGLVDVCHSVRVVSLQHLC